MKTIETLEETLEGGYGGLYGEVVTHDCYHLKEVTFQPDVVFDIGANVGIFSRYARKLFPEALILAVEPHPENCLHFRKFSKDPRMVLLEAALGKGQIYHGLTARNGSGETYLSAGLGYSSFDMEQAASLRNSLEFSNVPCFTLLDIVTGFWEEGKKTILKVDCEGAENCIWTHKSSMKILKQMDFIAIELHSYALTGVQMPEVLDTTNRALKSLESTHNCKRDGVHFWASKKL